LELYTLSSTNNILVLNQGAIHFPCIIIFDENLEIIKISIFENILLHFFGSIGNVCLDLNKELQHDT